MLELDPELLSELENGNELTFKGSLHEKVVLCSQKKTYDVRNAEQSNSLLVIPGLLSAQDTSPDSPLKSPVTNVINKSLDKSLEDAENETSQVPLIEREVTHKNILKIFYEYLECRQTKPRVKKLQELLHLTLFTGLENEHVIDRKFLFTRHQLFNTAQCSAGELDEILAKIRCIKIDGFMRLLDYTYEYRVVTLMMSLINENSWNLDSVERSESIAALEGIIPDGITHAVFDYYTEKIPATGKYRYKVEMVCRIIAQNVLQEGLKFHIDEFLETCQSALPEGMIMEESYLAGLGIIDRESQTPSISGLFEENMPMVLSERLLILFKSKPKWTLQEISPYIELFVTPQLAITALLAKHVRTLIENGTRYYVAKHK